VERNGRPPLHELSRRRWDLLIIGGGITGAGIFREAAGLGLRTLLVEREDYASGTSSQSAKLVHGGLHYLSRFQLGLARESIRERNHLLHEGAGLVDAIDFVLPVAAGDWKHSCTTMVGLGVYHAIGGKMQGSPHLDRGELERIAPGLDTCYRTAHRYFEGQTDDARLTLRVIAAGERDQGLARNYTEVIALIRDRHGAVTGAEVLDRITGEAFSISARFVINATGPWSDQLRARLGHAPRQRLIGGSHLVIPRHRLPVTTGIAVYHVDSGLPLYIVPWRGVTLIGTTHIESGAGLDTPPGISAAEAPYLLAGVNALFPDARLSARDIQAAFTGYRPIIDTRTADPARASRDYGIWIEQGLMTVTGGKLTTHRSMARQVMRRITPRLVRQSGYQTALPLCQSCATTEETGFTQADRCRLEAHYGPGAVAAMLDMSPAERQQLPGLADLTLAELRWAARAESVHHLDDLLTRRTRIALLAPDGGHDLLDLIEPVAREELAWDADRWRREVERYETLWACRYAPAISGASSVCLAEAPLSRAS